MTLKNNLFTISSEKMDQETSGTTKMYSNFPPSLQSSWENEFVVKIKWKRRREKACGMRNNGKPFNGKSYRYSSFCGKNATMTLCFALMIVVIFNTNVSFQRPVHNQAEEGSLTSAMVRPLYYSIEL